MLMKLTKTFEILSGPMLVESGKFLRCSWMGTLVSKAIWRYRLRTVKGMCTFSPDVYIMQAVIYVGKSDPPKIPNYLM